MRQVKEAITQCRAQDHLAELEVESTDVVVAWSALEPVVAQCAETVGVPATKSDYQLATPTTRAPWPGPNFATASIG